MEHSDAKRQATASRAFALAVMVTAGLIVACSPAGTLAQSTNYQDAYVRFQIPEGWSASARPDATRDGFWQCVRTRWRLEHNVLTNPAWSERRG